MRVMVFVKATEDSETGVLPTPEMLAAGHNGGMYLSGPDLYAGAGLSYGESKTHDGLRGRGIQGEVGFGYELLRRTVLRTFVQVVATLPFYEVFRDEYVPYDSQSSAPQLPLRITSYAFTVAASIGVGF